jgi:hypothetical protein
MVINSKTTHLLVTLSQKMYDQPFNVPFQGVYEAATPDEVMQRYNLVVDGEFYDGKRIKHITKEGAIADTVAQETTVLRNELAALNGKYWDVVTRLSAAENEIGPLKSELAASLIRFQALQQEIQAAAPELPLLADKVEHRVEARTVANLSGWDLLAELRARIRRRLFA